MRQLILTTLLLGTLCYGQTENCDCSGPLSKDLNEQIATFDSRSFKDWLSEYFRRDETFRSEMKKNAQGKWSSQFMAVINAAPIKSKSDGSASYNKENQDYYNLEEFYSKNYYVSEDLFYAKYIARM